MLRVSSLFGHTSLTCSTEKSRYWKYENTKVFYFFFFSPSDCRQKSWSWVSHSHTKFHRQMQIIALFFPWQDQERTKNYVNGTCGLAFIHSHKVVVVVVVIVVVKCAASNWYKNGDKRKWQFLIWQCTNTEQSKNVMVENPSKWPGYKWVLNMCALAEKYNHQIQSTQATNLMHVKH